VLNLPTIEKQQRLELRVRDIVNIPCNAFEAAHQKSRQKELKAATP
jgi:hypothetical protein